MCENEHIWQNIACVVAPRLSLPSFQLPMWRAIFLPAYITYLLVGLTVNLAYFLQTPEHAGWLASTLCHLIGLIWFLYLRSSKLASVNLISVVITASSGAALLIAAGYYVIVDNAAGIGLATSALAFLLWFVYQFSCLKITKYKGHLKVGDSFPEINFTEGGSVSVDEMKGQLRWVVFDEGNWNAFSIYQRNLLAEASPDFKAYNCRVFRVGTHPPREKQLPGIYQSNVRSAEALDANKLLLKSSLPIGISSGSLGRDVIRPSAFLVNDKDIIEAISMPNDRRKLPSANFLLRYLKEKGA